MVWRGTLKLMPRARCLCEFCPLSEMMEHNCAGHIHIERNGRSMLRNVNQFITHLHLFWRKPFTFIAHHKCGRPFKWTLCHRQGVGGNLNTTYLTTSCSRKFNRLLQRIKPMHPRVPSFRISPTPRKMFPPNNNDLCPKRVGCSDQKSKIRSLGDVMQDQKRLNFLGHRKREREDKTTTAQPFLGVSLLGATGFRYIIFARDNQTDRLTQQESPIALSNHIDVYCATVI